MRAVRVGCARAARRRLRLKPRDPPGGLFCAELDVAPLFGDAAPQILGTGLRLDQLRVRRQRQIARENVQPLGIAPPDVPERTGCREQQQRRGGRDAAQRAAACAARARARRRIGIGEDPHEHGVRGRGLRDGSLEGRARDLRFVPRSRVGRSRRLRRERRRGAVLIGAVDLGARFEAAVAQRLGRRRCELAIELLA